MPEYRNYVGGLPDVPSAPVSGDRIPVYREGSIYAASALGLIAPTSEPVPVQAITMTAKPKFVADGGALKLDVAATVVPGTYNVGAIIGRSRARIVNGVETDVGSTGQGESYTPVSADVGYTMLVYETVRNDVTGETKTFASEVVGPILPADTVAGGALQTFDFTASPSPTGVTVARASALGTRRSGVATVAIVPADTLRYQHNAEGGLVMGVLCEQARTNLFPDARDMGSVMSAVNGATKTSNYGVAPNGATESTRVVVAAGSSNAGVNLGISNVTAAAKMGVWVRSVPGTAQEFVVSNPTDGSYVYRKTPASTAWTLVELQGTAAPGSNFLNFRVLNSGTAALDLEVWGGLLQIGTSGPNTLVATDAASATRPKEVLTFTLATASVTRDIQVVDQLGQTQNFLSQVIAADALWKLDADALTTFPIVAQMHVYTEGTIGATPAAAPAPAPAPSGGPTINVDVLMSRMKLVDDQPAYVVEAGASGAPGTVPRLPAQQASIQSPLNTAGIEYMCRQHGGIRWSDFPDYMDSIPTWLWLYRGAGMAAGKRIQFRNLIPSTKSASTGLWTNHPMFDDMAGQLWKGHLEGGTVGTRQRKESTGGSSVLLTGDEGVEVWVTPGFYCVKNRSIMTDLAAAGFICEIRVINDDGTQYSGADAKVCAAVGYDIYASGRNVPNIGYVLGSQGTHMLDGGKCRWATIDCSTGWQPVAMIGTDACYKKDGPRPPWGNYTGSWPVTSSTYNLTEAQIRAGDRPSWVTG